MSAPLFLDERAVEQFMPDPATARDLVRGCLTAYARGEVENPPKIGVHPPGSRHLHAMPAYVPTDDGGVVGLKWLSHLPRNRERGLPTIHAMVLLNDPADGSVRVVMHASALTGVRTAAVTQVAIDALSQPGPVLVVGTGVQARTHLRSLVATRPDLQELVVVGRSRESAQAVCQDVAGQVRPAVDLEASVRAAATLVTVTDQTQGPLIAAEWLAPGSTWVDLDDPVKDVTSFQALDALVVDSWEQSPLRARASGLMSAGLALPPALLGEIAETLPTPLRARHADRVVVAPSGIGACDLMIAHEIWRRATA